MVRDKVGFSQVSWAMFVRYTRCCGCAGSHRAQGELNGTKLGPETSYWVQAALDRSKLGSLTSHRVQAELNGSKPKPITSQQVQPARNRSKPYPLTSYRAPAARNETLYILCSFKTSRFCPIRLASITSPTLTSPSPPFPTARAAFCQRLAGSCKLRASTPKYRLLHRERRHHARNHTSDHRQTSHQRRA